MTKAIILAAALLLSACVTNDVELQHETTGSDEMLKSPCACMPVPYDGPSFKWGRG